MRFLYTYERQIMRRKLVRKIIVAAIVTVTIVQLVSCASHKSELVYDINMRIVDIDKASSSQLSSTILLETISGEKLYREISSREGHFRIDTEWLYNHKSGDIVHFDYLRKSKFFRIKNRL